MSPVSRGPQDLSVYPGGDLVAKGLADLNLEILSEEGLLVLVASPRLRDLGIDVPCVEGISMPYEHALFEAIEARMPRGAHGAYNALIERVVSFANAYRPESPI